MITKQKYSQEILILFMNKQTINRIQIFIL
jgi:hypothetical protein